MEELLIELLKEQNIRNENNFISGLDYEVFKKILSYTSQEPKDLFMVLHQCFCAVDTTECPISSSENFKQQKLFFSGKKHRTTLKYQTICDFTCHNNFFLF
jgi:hypothetical protein